MTISNFNLPHPECIALLVQVCPIDIRDLHNHPVNVRTVNAPEFRIRELQGDRCIPFTWSQRKGLSLVCRGLVVWTEGCRKHRELCRLFQIIFKEDAVLDDGSVRRDLAADLLTTNLDRAA